MQEVLLIRSIEIFRLTIPMEPFVIATETCDAAKNIYIRIHTNKGITGVGECSPFPMLVGETQDTCFYIGKDLAAICIGKNALEIENRLNELDAYVAANTTIKSAFDMALHDIAAKHEGKPLYQWLGGSKKSIQTDLTIGINSPDEMARTAIEFVNNGVQIIKVKLGKNGKEDIVRVRKIREAVGNEILLRLDANQGWDFETAKETLQAVEPFNIQFCEQPMRKHLDPLLPSLRKAVKIPIMADESVFNHYDAARIIESNSCDYINIKLAKSGGILEAKRIADLAQQHNIKCMLGGMVESRLALTAKLHFARSHSNICFYDLDTCMLGHLADPVLGGVRFNQFYLDTDDVPGIGADIDPEFLHNAEHITIN
ncbi:MAG: hypothetical protein RL131_1231 [Bacteroidota bacterium]